MSTSNISVGTKAWADRINAAWQNSIESILNVGKLLLEAKAALPAGDFKNMTANELNFHQTTSSRLMLIAKDARLYAHAHKLPPHWATLYELTKLTDEEFTRALESGVISPEMERSDVPREPRNLSANPRGRPKMIEGKATEVKPEALPMPEPSRPIGQPHPAPAQSVPPWEESPASLRPYEDDPVSIKLSNEALRRAIDRQDHLDDPDLQVQPFGSGDTITAVFARNRPDVNFWQGLLLALGEWTKLGSLDALVPNAETEKSLALYDLTQFIVEFDELNERLTSARNAA